MESIQAKEAIINDEYWIRKKSVLILYDLVVTKTLEWPR